MKNNYGKIRINEQGDKTIKVKKSDLEALEKESSAPQQKKEESTSYGGLIGAVVTQWLIGKGIDALKAKQAASAAQAALQQGATAVEATTQAAQTAGLSTAATSELTSEVTAAATRTATQTATGAAAEATKKGAVRQTLQQAAKTPLKELATQRGLWLKGFFIRDPAIVAQMAEGNPGLARMAVQTLGRPITGLLTKSAGAVGIDAATLGTGVGEVAAGTVGLAILVGTIVGTSVGWITNKTLSWFGTGFKEQAKDTIERAIKDRSFLLAELDNYQKLGGYKYEAGDEDDKDSDYGMLGLGYSTKGERVKKFGIPGFRDYERTPNSYDTKDGLIIINLLSILYDNDKRAGKITKSKEMVEGEDFELDDISNSNVIKYQKLINLFGSIESGFKPRLLTKKFEDDPKLMSLIKALLISCAVANIPASKQADTTKEQTSMGEFSIKDVVKVKDEGDKLFIIINFYGNSIIIMDENKNKYKAKLNELIKVENVRENKKANIRKSILKELNFLLEYKQFNEQQKEEAIKSINNNIKEVVFNLYDPTLKKEYQQTRKSVNVPIVTDDVVDYGLTGVGLDVEYFQNSFLNIQLSDQTYKNLCQYKNFGLIVLEKLFGRDTLYKTTCKNNVITNIEEVETVSAPGSLAKAVAAVVKKERPDSIYNPEESREQEQSSYGQFKIGNIVANVENKKQMYVISGFSQGKIYILDLNGNKYTAEAKDLDLIK